MTNQFIPFGAAELRRDAHLRSDVDRLWASADVQILPMSNLRPACRDDHSLAFYAKSQFDGVIGQNDRLFLGTDAADTPYFTCAVPAGMVRELGDDGFLSAEAASDHFPNSRFRDLRAVFTELKPLDANLAATARALLSWHSRHGFCSNCGTKTELTQSGWQTRCPNCGASHFPRTDPVVIMNVTKGNKCLLGRSPGWPEGMYSTLAGFVEPGETPEAAVAREVLEETGVIVQEARYFGSQPWPFPANLMLGFHAIAVSEDIKIDPDELEDALWVTREDLLKIMAGEHPEIHAPRQGAIAQILLSNWLADGLNNNDK